MKLDEDKMPERLKMLEEKEHRDQVFVLKDEKVHAVGDRFSALRLVSGTIMSIRDAALFTLRRF